MARWQNHYELALRNALESRGAVLLPIDEGSQATPTGRTIKNFDFVLWRDRGEHWLVEVKGRKLGKSLTPNAWATLEDVASLAAWRDLMGADYLPVLAFVFDVTEGAGGGDSGGDSEGGGGDGGSVSGGGDGGGGGEDGDGDGLGAADWSGEAAGLGEMPWSSFSGADVIDDEVREPLRHLQRTNGTVEHFCFGGRAYQAWVIRLDAFAALARLRSERWRTRMLSVAAFRSHARPLLDEALGVIVRDPAAKAVRD